MAAVPARLTLVWAKDSVRVPGEGGSGGFSRALPRATPHSPPQPVVSVELHHTQGWWKGGVGQPGRKGTEPALGFLLPRTPCALREEQRWCR